MRADYNSLIYAYESNNLAILDIMSDELEVATEADEQTPAELNAENATRDTVSTDENKQVTKTVLINKVIERVKAFIRKIGEIFEGLKRKLSNRLRTLAETDKGFYSLYYKRKSMVKPYQKVRVISYQYNNSAMDQPIEKIMNETVRCLEKLRAIEGTSNGDSRISEIINANQGNVIEVLLAPYAKDSDIPVTSVPEFIRYIVSKFRGEKKELVYSDTQLNNIEANALSTKELASKCNGYLNAAQQAFNKIKGLEYQINRSSADPKVANLVATNAAKAATLYNAYSALINAYYELKLEQSLNYRIILKKFYQF